MTVLQTLASAPTAYPLSGGLELRKHALARGMDKSDLDAIASQELKAHGNPYYLAFKSQVVGVAGGAVFLGASFFAFHQGAIPVSLAMIGLCLLTLQLRGWGQREEARAALAAAVLRHRAAGLTVDEISVLKDRPELRDCRDSQKFLTDIQQSLQQATTVGIS